jgi:hypothetical protein
VPQVQRKKSEQPVQMKIYVRTKGSNRGSTALAVLTCATLSVALCIYSAAGFLRLGSDARSLRDSLASSPGFGLTKRFEINVGPITTGLIRRGLLFVEVDEELGAALQAVRSVEVGIYQAAWDEPGLERASLLARADESMAGRGWERTVSVVNGRELVAIYMPEGKSASRNIRAVIAVLSGDDLVLVSGRSNLEPLMRLAMKKAAFEGAAFSSTGAGSPCSRDD